jgi:hypothetical protein
MNPKPRTFGDVLEKYPFREAWKMIVASMLRKIKQGMDKKRFRIK